MSLHSTWNLIHQLTKVCLSHPYVALGKFATCSWAWNKRERKKQSAKGHGASTVPYALEPSSSSVTLCGGLRHELVVVMDARNKKCQPNFQLCSLVHVVVCLWSECRSPEVTPANSQSEKGAEQSKAFLVSLFLPPTSGGCPLELLRDPIWVQ